MCRLCWRQSTLRASTSCTRAWVAHFARQSCATLPLVHACCRLVVAQAASCTTVAEEHQLMCRRRQSMRVCSWQQPSWRGQAPGKHASALKVCSFERPPGLTTRCLRRLLRCLLFVHIPNRWAIFLSTRTPHQPCRRRREGCRWTRCFGAARWRSWTGQSRSLVRSGPRCGQLIRLALHRSACWSLGGGGH